MKIEIDQSGKLEDTHQDTVIAYANGKTGSLKVRSATKRAVQKIFRALGEPRSYIIHTFTTLIFLLIEGELSEVSDIVIDIEYPGFEIVISKLLATIGKGENRTMPDVYFKLVGKSARCHRIAIQTFRRKLKANKVVSPSELQKALFSVNKKGRPALKYHLP